LEVPPSEVISSCLELVASMALFYPDDVTANIRTVFLPYSMNEDTIERSLMGHVLYSAECTQTRLANPTIMSNKSGMMVFNFT